MKKMNCVIASLSLMSAGAWAQSASSDPMENTPGSVPNSTDTRRGTSATGTGTTGADASAGSKTTTSSRGGTAKTGSGAASSQSGGDYTRELQSRLRADKALSTYASGLRLNTINGVVTLQGRVNTPSEQRRVEAIAREVAGGEQYRTELIVGNTSTDRNAPPPASAR